MTPDEAPRRAADPAADIEKQFRATLVGVERRMTGAMQPTPSSELRSLVDEAELMPDPEPGTDTASWALSSSSSSRWHSCSEARGSSLPERRDGATVRAAGVDRRSGAHPRVALPALSHLLSMRRMARSSCTGSGTNGSPTARACPWQLISTGSPVV
jgi:hypothetical protein